MKIIPISVLIATFTKNYKNDGDGGVVGYDDRLTIRPSFQLNSFIRTNREI